jgi:hypothetical protein
MTSDEAANFLPQSLDQLMKLIADKPHDNSVIQDVREFLATLPEVQRQEFFNQSGVMLQAPIIYEAAVERGILEDKEDNRFTLLNGDFISTDAAYILGKRIEGNPKYLVCNSTCDLVPGRRKGSAVLVSVNAVHAKDVNASQTLNELLSFKRNNRLYLPAISSDAEDVVANFVDFTKPATIEFDSLMISTRNASLGLLGWRLFAAMWRNMYTREADREAELRV